MSITKIPLKLRYEILERDKRRCLWCGRSSINGVQLHIDHIIPENFGGSTTYENLGTLCDKCNLGKSTSYSGNYLLMTLFNIPDFESKIELEKLGNQDSKGIIYDGNVLRYILKFYKKPNPAYSYEIAKVFQEFVIGVCYWHALQKIVKFKLIWKKEIIC